METINLKIFSFDKVSSALDLYSHELHKALLHKVQILVYVADRFIHFNFFVLNKFFNKTNEELSVAAN